MMSSKTSARVLATIACWTIVEGIHIAQIAPTTIEPLSFTLNASYSIILNYRDIPELNTINPFRIKTSSSTAVTRMPILVVTQQERYVTAWSIPYSLETSNKSELLFFTNVSKTMCHDSMDDIVKNFPSFSIRPLQVSQSFIVTLSTSSPSNVSVDLELEEQKDFYVKMDTNYTLTVSPSEPKYVFFEFGQDTEDTIVVHVDSEDDGCLVVSVQDSKCPVHDMNNDIKYEGMFQTINLQGTMTIKRSRFDYGFYLVFVAKPDNYECSQEGAYLPRGLRLYRVSNAKITTKISFTIKNSISYREYMIAIIGTLAVLVLAGIVLIVVVLIFHRYGTISKEKSNDDIHYEYVMPLTDMQISKLLEQKELTVSYFSRHPMRIKKRSYNYLSHILSIAVFYSIPVIQLVFTYQRIVNVTGNEDMCYYNFMCAHPALGFSDFNHIYSNIGYIVFGVVISIVVMDRHRLVKMRKEKGIPVHYGIFHAMGIALIIEGLLSACYHICPSQSNYQFDTSFMYVMAVLCMIKLYQNRHPDINASAYSTFTILGMAIFLATVGIINGTIMIWILFAVIYTGLCVTVSFKIYFLNHVLDGLKQFKEGIDNHGLSWNAFIPLRKGRFILLLIANIANYAVVITGICMYGSTFTDFGTFLLSLLLGNALIHTCFYTAMKVLSGEKICFEASLYGLLSIGCWAGSAVFFLDAATLWTVTPAESRQWNQECILLNFYDRHDIWHLLSAPALYFTFMFLMTLDDDLIGKKQEEIPVF